MIDINKLRRLVQEATHPTTKGRWIRLFGERTVYDRLEDGCRGIPVVSTPAHPPHPFEAACLDFIAAASPAAISELLDHLEAAESDAAHQKGLAESAVRVAEGWERKCGELRALMATLRSEISGLHAKIAQMERQEPVAWMLNCQTFGGDTGWILSWTQSGAGLCDRLPGTENEKKLYALPGAKGED